MNYNKHRQFESNEQWDDEDPVDTQGCGDSILTNKFDALDFQDESDDETAEEETLNSGFTRKRKLGKKGNPTNVTINYVSISFTDPKAFIFHYNVRIEPEPARLKLCRKVLETTETERFPNSVCAFDGRKHLYTKRPITGYRQDSRMSEMISIFSEENTFNTIKRFNAIDNSNWLPTWFRYQSSSYKECKSIARKTSVFHTVSLWDEENLAKRSFKINVRLEDVLKYEDVLNATHSSAAALKKAVEAVETIVGENALKKCQERKLTQSGDILFMRHANPVGQISGGVTLQFGFRQSIVKRSPLFHYNFFLAIDMTYGCFFDTMPVIDLISLICGKPKSLLSTSPLEPRELLLLKNHLTGFRVVFHDPGYAMTNREHIVSDVAASADAIRFPIGPQGSFNSHNSFFPLGNSYDLEFPKMPCLVVGPPGMMLGLPPELCTVAEGQIFNRRMTYAQKEELKNLLIQLKPQPKQIKNEIVNMVAALGLENNDLFSNFDIHISNNLVKTNGRVLKPPILVCKSAMFSGIKQVLPKESSWDLEHFEDAVTVERWAICSVDIREDPDLQFLATALRFRGLRLGMTIEEPKLFSKVVQAEEDFEKDFEIFLRERKSENCEVVLVVMPSSGMFYGKIKQIAELQVGILTQCLKSSTVLNLDLSIMNNLLLKLNAKLNGNSYNIKSSLWPKYFIRPVLVVGAFVNVHDHNRNPCIPFIASVVGNYNKHATKHNVIWSFLKSDSDYITNLDKIIAEILTRYHQECGLYPEKILYFRDGVLEENVLTVMENEARLMREGCTALHALYHPSLTFIDVSRNHPTMFLPNKQAEVQAGTVVDSTIVHPNEVEFYLMSHISHLGSPRPTKYRLLMDESHLSEDVIQEIIFYLCHLSCRCTRTVPFPVQLYYARLATQRAQKYFDRSFVDDEDIDKTIKGILNVNKLLEQNPMFFV